MPTVRRPGLPFCSVMPPALPPAGPVPAVVGDPVVNIAAAAGLAVDGAPDMAARGVGLYGCFSLLRPAPTHGFILS